jgi:hypothetical protein
MMRVWLNGFVLGAVSMLAVLVVIWLAQPSHLRELDGYPADPNKDAVPAPPDSIPLNSAPLPQ